MSDGNDSTEFVQDTHRFEAVTSLGDSCSTETTVELSSAADDLLKAMSRFSDIVSQTLEPFDEKLLRLLALGRGYLNASEIVYGVFRDTTLFLTDSAVNPSLIAASCDLEHPLLQECIQNPLPIDVFCKESTPLRFSKDGATLDLLSPHQRVLAVAVRSEQRLLGAMLFVLPEVNGQKVDEQLLFVKMFARYIGNEANRSQVRAALQYRIAYEQLLSDIAREFIHVEVDCIDATIIQALKRIAQFSKADMSYILQFQDKQSRINISHWWMDDDRVPDFPLEDIPVERFAWSLGKVLEGEVVVLADPETLPAEADKERRFLQAQGINTALLTPLLHGGKVIGLVGFASTKSPIPVNKDSTQLLQMVGHTLASVVALKKARERVALLEAQIRHTQKLESLGVLAGGIAHDFNNLLMGILGNAGIALRDGALNEQTHDAVQRIERIACHAGELTNQLLAYSGRGKFVVESVNLSDIAATMKDLLQTVVSKRHTLRTNFAQDLPVVEVDVSQLSQVVMNLITNASEAIGGELGEITLSTGLLSVSKNSLYESYFSNDTPDGVYVYLRVKDSGCGMDAATRAKIFDPFYSTKFTGRGLGLAAVLGIVRSHGGTIRVDSAVGEGTTFSVLLPCAPNQTIASRAAEPIAKIPKSEGLNAFAGKCVLVVDDEEAIRIVLQSVLTGAGSTVLLAANGNEALNCFAKHRDSIDVCVIDMTMPDLSGVEVSRQIQAMQSSMPIILTSGYSEQEVKTHCATLCDTRFLQKPFHPQVLLDSLRGIFSESLTSA